MVGKWVKKSRCRFAKWIQGERWIWDEWSIRWREGFRRGGGSGWGNIGKTASRFGVVWKRLAGIRRRLGWRRSVNGVDVKMFEWVDEQSKVVEGGE